MIDLNELDELYNAATPGEWEAYNPGDGTRRLYTNDGSDDGARLVKVIGGHGSSAYLEAHDGDLIAALHNAYPALAKFVKDVLDAEVWQQHADGERVVMWSEIEQAAIDAGIKIEQ